MKNLTEKIVTEYIDGKGQTCPFCKHDLIEGGPITIEAGMAFQCVTCLKCRNVWDDIYELARVGAFIEDTYTMVAPERQ